MLQWMGSREGWGGGGGGGVSAGACNVSKSDASHSFVGGMHALNGNYSINYYNSVWLKAIQLQWTKHTLCTEVRTCEGYREETERTSQLSVLLLENSYAKNPPHKSPRMHLEWNPEKNRHTHTHHNIYYHRKM